MIIFKMRQQSKTQITEYIQINIVISHWLFLFGKNLRHKINDMHVADKNDFYANQGLTSNHHVIGEQ